MALTNARSTPTTVLDYFGAVVTLPANAIPYTGARYINHGDSQTYNTGANTGWEAVDTHLDKVTKINPYPYIRHEPAATNLLLHSESFDNAVWINTGFTITPDYNVGGDGREDSDLIAHSSVINNYAIYDHTNSAFIISETVYQHGAGQSLSFTTPVGCTEVRVYPAMDVGGIASIYQIVTVAASTEYTFSFDSQPTKSFDSYYFGAQLELGAFATSYIKTTTTQISRSADETRLPLNLDGNIYQSKGILVFKAKFGYDSTIGGNKNLISISTSLSNILYISSSGFRTYDGVTTNTVGPSGILEGEEGMAAVVWNASQSLFSISYSVDNGATWSGWSREPYDGDFAWGSNINLFTGSLYPNNLKNLKIYNPNAEHTMSSMESWVTENAGTITADAVPVNPNPLATFYVDRDHGSANNTNPGTEALPWLTVVHAANTVTAGQTVYVKKGVYDDGDVILGNSGTLGSEILIAAYPGHERQAVLMNAGFKSEGKSHYILHGMRVQHSPNDGIRVNGPILNTDPPAENVIISGNYIHDTRTSNISVWGVDWNEDAGNYDNIKDVTIKNNLLELGTNGGKNEVISIANGASNIDICYNELRMGDPAFFDGDEGIDLKEGVKNSRIFGNLIHDLADKAIYMDGGSGSDNFPANQPFVNDIDIFDNVMYNTPSNGMSITTEGKGNTFNINIYNNLVYDMPKDGILVYDHPGGETARGGPSALPPFTQGMTYNVFVVNNTVVNCGVDAATSGSYRVNHEFATNVVFRNNIGWGGFDYDFRGEDATAKNENQATIFSNNLGIATDTPPPAISSDPLFVTGGYKLQVTSPAIDEGTDTDAPSVDIDGNTRPVGFVDIGAYEYTP